ncbi:MAG: TrmH family RNA methyltransferase [Candidatus Vogelbacteria bacterium]|nr:TrmH family RNA methyltransferase [Candidatus Vogelbacteria bacterium]
MSNKKLILIIDNIRSVYNIGSIFRTADAVGVSKIFLVGITPHPVDRFGRERKNLSKVALGAEKIIPWEHAATLNILIKKLRATKTTIVALEQAENSVDYKKFKPIFPMALILGEEVSGIKKATLKLCDSIIEIPMRGQKESLNVSVSAGIAMFRILDK